MDTHSTQPLVYSRPARQQPWVPHHPREEPALEPSNTTHPVWRVAFGLVVALLFAITAYRAVAIHQPGGGDHYLYMAHHLARGQLHVDDLPFYYPDYVEWQGHKYLPFGLLPGVALLPFVELLPFAFFLPLGLAHDFSWVGHLYSLLNVWLLWKVLGRAGVVGERRRWATLLFFGGTFYFAQAFVSNSWYFSHVIAVTCMLAAMWAALGKRRPFLVGVFLGLAGLTRVTTLFALPFFLWLMWRIGEASEASVPESATPTFRKRSARFAAHAGLLALGLAGPIAVLLLYDYLRFGNPLESGYSLSAQNGIVPSLDAARRDFGLFSLAHIPRNLFLLFLQGPLPYPELDVAVLQFPYVRPSSWGLGLFFASPALLYAFRANIRHPLTQACWLGTLCALVPVITHFAPGWVQFGYRYTLDFLPIFFLLAARGLPNPMTNASRAFILASVAINIWGALFLMHWQFEVPKT